MEEVQWAYGLYYMAPRGPWQLRIPQQFPQKNYQYPPKSSWNTPMLWQARPPQ